MCDDNMNENLVVSMATPATRVRVRAFQGQETAPRWILVLVLVLGLVMEAGGAGVDASAPSLYHRGSFFFTVV